MPRRKAGSNVAGLERTLRALEARLGDEHEALVALARGLAAAVDVAPESAALWREYRAAVAALSEAGAAGDVDDDTQSFLRSMRVPVSSKVGDPKNS